MSKIRQKVYGHSHVIGPKGGHQYGLKLSCGHTELRRYVPRKAVCNSCQDYIDGAEGYGDAFTRTLECVYHKNAIKRTMNRKHPLFNMFRRGK